MLRSLVGSEMCIRDRDGVAEGPAMIDPPMVILRRKRLCGKWPLVLTAGTAEVLCCSSWSSSDFLFSFVGFFSFVRCLRERFCTSGSDDVSESDEEDEDEEDGEGDGDGAFFLCFFLLRFLFFFECFVTLFGMFCLGLWGSAILCSEGTGSCAAR